MNKIHFRKFKYKIQDFSKKERFKFILNSILAITAVAMIVTMANWQNNSSKTTDTTTVRVVKSVTEGGFEVGLGSDRESFLEKYQASSLNFLPQANIASSSLSGFINNNSTSALLPVRNWQVQFKDIDATTALVVYMPNQRVLYGKNVFEQRSIASLTKLMTALVVLDNFDPQDVITISQEAIRQEGDSARFVAGEQFTVNQLLYALLLESSNDAAYAFLEHYEKTNPGAIFTDAMNQRALDMGLDGTFFVDSSGLDDNNVSTSYEVAQLLYIAFKNDLLRQVMSEASYTVRSSNRDIAHFWVNLNSLLGNQEDIILGKTGFTTAAGPSMTAVANSPIQNNFMVTVVLDAQDRIEATKELIEWTKGAYIWDE